MLNSTGRSIPRYTFLFITSYLLMSESPVTQAQATPDQIAHVISKYDALEFSSGRANGFGIPLKALALLNVNYPNGSIKDGQPYNQPDVATKPTISVTPTASAVENFTAPSQFTLVMADANTIGNPDPLAGYRHYLQNGVTFADPLPNNTLNINEASGNAVTVTDYVGPAPLVNTGKHRYAMLLFAQPLQFIAPVNLSAVNTGPGNWDLKTYVTSTGLGDLVAASFFTIQNGTGSSYNATAINSTFDDHVASTKAKSYNGLAPGQYVNVSDLMKIVLGSGVIGIGSLMV
ncbi:uncharacterized protein MELLADRAFT_124549 [Melampsora larici-populina 98AG31]|uniref:Secreted protein n=1 Tax=Melampsora larici-populina (strain 98AG31 / pathotype 3-4-7) TaxID=747676 RepID=F4RGT0_MELLP|nr:uncharacterized protein MELLADRAFT_124549 [Melampsora larici-populina 98AG31]EGG08338.1 hypothetical protein MELLADRAFT_124549 [Melampsora larici-populina 98AG31]